MKKIRKVLEFILALLNFLFHFKPVPDETPPISPESFPLPDYQDLETVSYTHLTLPTT